MFFSIQFSAIYQTCYMYVKFDEIILNHIFYKISLTHIRTKEIYSNHKTVFYLKIITCKNK